MRFGFGKNWKNYISRNFSEERINITQKHLLNFLALDNLKGLHFLDIGCGSGLHSLAALRGGAAKVVSFDFDPDSVTTSLRLKEYAGNPNHWEVKQGSILDDAFVNQLEPADIVYSWGVLHHTGNMWRAMDQAAKLLKDQALFYVALYDYDVANPSPEFWLDVKSRYNQGNWFRKQWLVIWYYWEFYLYKKLWNLPGLIKRSIDYKHSRGMSLYYDTVDWVGGWPMEYAKPDDVKKWGGKQGFKLINIVTGEGNAEYLFRRIE